MGVKYINERQGKEYKSVSRGTKCTHVYNSTSLFESREYECVIKRNQPQRYIKYIYVSMYAQVLSAIMQYKDSIGNLYSVCLFVYKYICAREQVFILYIYYIYNY